MESSRHSIIVRSICVILIVSLSLFMATGVKAADPSVGSPADSQGNTNVIVTSPKATFARIRDGVCEVLTADTTSTKHEISSTMLRNGQISRTMTASENTVLTVDSWNVDAVTASKYSSMAPKELGALIATSPVLLKTWSKADVTYSVYISVTQKYHDSTVYVSGVGYHFVNPVSTQGNIYYLDPQVRTLDGFIELRCMGFYWTTPDPYQHYAGEDWPTPHYQSLVVPSTVLNQVYTMIDNGSTRWYDIAPGGSFIEPHWTVRIKRGTVTTWTVTAGGQWTGMPD